MQWALLPGRAYREARLEVAGFLEPAYLVVGDGFDWSRRPDSLQATVCEGTGRGVEATLAASLALGAVRNARRAGLDLLDQAHLSDQALYSHYGGRQHVAALLLDLRLADGRLQVVDAGSPQLLRMRPSGAVEEVVLDEQLPLGMFEDTPYTVQTARLEPGDRLVALSEGVGTTVSPQGAVFGGDLLLAAIRRTRLLSAAEAVRSVIRVMGEHRIDPDPLDDAVVLCLDWHGGPAG
jgi:serine phosphatase RsbU (regulator of sigma subunit)